MSYHLQFTDDAEDDLFYSSKYYDFKQSGLGDRFLASVNEQLERIQINPNLFPVVAPKVHRAPLSKFPYGIIYELIDTNIYVVAVFHAKRNPKQWKKRIKR
jgi:plasmid stabilization system protein ParE